MFRDEKNSKKTEQRRAEAEQIKKEQVRTDIVKVLSSPQRKYYTVESIDGSVHQVPSTEVPRNLLEDFQRYPMFLRRHTHTHNSLS